MTVSDEAAHYEEHKRTQQLCIILFHKTTAKTTVNVTTEYEHICFHVKQLHIAYHPVKTVL
jgi:hypothetical protein